MGAEQAGAGLQEPLPAPPASGLQEPGSPADDAAARWWASQHEAYHRIWNSDRSLPERLWEVTRQSMRTRPDAEENLIREQIRLGVRPPNESIAAYDAMRESPAAAVFYGAAGLLGASEHKQNLAAQLGAAAGGLTMAGGSLAGRAPLYTGAVQPPEPPPQEPVSSGPFRQGALPEPSKVGPSTEDFEGLVREHSKGNEAPLTPAGARAIFTETQPPWTSAHVAGDNVPGADVRYRDFSGTELPGTGTQVKSLTSTKGFEKEVRKELRQPTGSPVVAVQMPRGTNPDRLMGKLRNNLSHRDVTGRSIVIVDEDGKVLAGKQPFPQLGKESR